MKLSQAKEYLPFVQAAAEGKIIQCQCLSGWKDMSEAGFHERSSEYRIKPTLTLRPWNPEEVPVGAKFHVKGSTCWTTVVEAGFNAVALPQMSGNFDIVEYVTLLKNWEHSIDQGKTWLSCGVFE